MAEEINQENIENSGKIITQLIENEMSKSYLEYAMSVIVSRALPDVRDGLKPVHRRVLFAMHEMGMFHDKPYKKSARIVGECLGKFHPHGDSAVYNTMVRLAQPWSLRYPLIDGQGNFGSIDGDSPAAMRYTEARLKKIAEDIMFDLKKETVNFKPNFDGSLKEPEVMPAKIPNLLINGSSGIAVGMATNIPPHNLSEIVKGIKHIIDNPETEALDLMEHVSGPDFPTGGIIMGNAGIKQAYLTGKGKVIVRAKTHEEEKRNRQHIIVDEIPYMVNKSMLIEQIADLVRDKHVPGIADLKDESDRTGMRIVITLKKDASSEIVLNQLFKHSRMQVTFGINSLALVDQQPKTLNLLEMMQHFITHRIEVVTRRIQFDLNKAEKRLHILEGLVIALNNIDKIIQLIKQSKSGIEAKESLMVNYQFSDVQSQAILDMKLQRLTNLEQDKIKNEHDELIKLISELKEILNSKQKILEIIKSELDVINEKYGDERRTQIIEGGDLDIDIEDLIKEEKMIVTITHKGYIKRQCIGTYKKQKRGGKGVIGTGTTDEDFVENLFVASTHSYILCFTDKGQLYWLKVYRIPEGSRISKGKPIINLVMLDPDEKITAMIPVREFNQGNFLIMATKKGVVKRCDLTLFSRPRKGGIRGMNLDDNDQLVNVLLTNGNDLVIIATKNGMAVKFKETDLRSLGRTARGVRGISLKKNDKVIGAVIGNSQETILTVTEKGYGKRTSISEYRTVKRGGVGVTNIKCTSKNGPVVGVKNITSDNEIMLISQKGIMIRMGAKNISIIGRSTQGVRLMKIGTDDKVMAIAKIAVEDLNNEEDQEDNNEINENTQNPEQINNNNFNEQESEDSEIFPKESEDETDMNDKHDYIDPLLNKTEPEQEKNEDYNPKPNPVNVPTLDELRARLLLKKQQN